MNLFRCENIGQVKVELADRRHKEYLRLCEEEIVMEYKEAKMNGQHY